MPQQEETDRKWWGFSMEEYLKNEKRMTQEDIDALRSWLEKQPHLPNISEEQLAVFLAACEFSIEASKKTIDICYTLRTKHHRQWSDRDIDCVALNDLRHALKIGCMPHKKGRPNIFFSRLDPVEPSLFDIELSFRVGFMMQDITCLMVGPNPEGGHFVFDLGHTTLSHILRNPLTAYAAIIRYSQEGSTCPIRGIHFINSGAVIETLLSLLKPFFSAKVWALINVHDKISGLQKHFDLDELPEDYNGKCPSLEEFTKKTFDLLREYRPWLEYEETLRVIEEKRPAGSRIDGLEGSFRKLDLD